MNWKRALAASALTLPLLLLFWHGLGLDPRQVPSMLPGSVAPEFTLAVMGPSDDDATDSVRLTDLRGELVVVNFWASWCVPCRYEHGALVRASRRYGERVRFFGILYNDTRSSARAFLRELGDPGYPTLLDPGQRTAIDFGLTGVPETFFLRRDGTVAHHQWGPVTDQLLTAQLDRLLAEEPSVARGEGAL